MRVSGRHAARLAHTHRAAGEPELSDTGRGTRLIGRVATASAGGALLSLPPPAAAGVADLRRAVGRSVGRPLRRGGGGRRGVGGSGGGLQATGVPGRVCLTLFSSDTDSRSALGRPFLEASVWPEKALENERRKMLCAGKMSKRVFSGN